MIIKRLSLTDIGVYAGEQHIEFAPPSAERPVTLIGGLNGAGKTTLIRSIFHALYGAHALPLIERRGSYDRYLRDTMRSQAETSSVSLEFDIRRGAEVETILVRREWRARKD